jgi:hypothetical protein
MSIRIQSDYLKNNRRVSKTNDRSLTGPAIKRILIAIIIIVNGRTKTNVNQIHEKCDFPVPGIRYIMKEMVQDKEAE